MAESIKPDNVIIVKDPEAPGGERAKVLDFGIAEGTTEADSQSIIPQDREVLAN